MHRTVISLETEQYELLRHEARRRGVSLSALLRELVAARYQKRNTSARAGVDPLTSMTGIGAGTAEPVGRRHNSFLYGHKRA